MTKMSKTDTLFITNAAEKPYPSSLKTEATKNKSWLTGKSISHTKTVSRQRPLSVFLLTINLARVFKRLLARKKVYYSLPRGQPCKFVKSS